MVIYIAGIKRLIKTDRSGKELWHARLPEQKTSISRLFATKDYLLMVNMGFAPHSYSFYYTYLGKWGKPFLAAYDKKTGKNVYMHERKKYVDFIKDVEFRDDDALFLLFADQEGHQSVEKYQADNTYGQKGSGTSGDSVFGQYECLRWLRCLCQEGQSVCPLG